MSPGFSPLLSWPVCFLGFKSPAGASFPPAPAGPLAPFLPLPEPLEGPPEGPEPPPELSFALPDCFGRPPPCVFCSLGGLGDLGWVLLPVPPWFFGAAPQPLPPLPLGPRPAPPPDPEPPPRPERPEDPLPVLPVGFFGPFGAAPPEFLLFSDLLSLPDAPPAPELPDEDFPRRPPERFTETCRFTFT
ncbi:hypothetical protein SANTM175S_01397 [Streptomyces antimycoticus]